jgi:hypothetical protein
MERYYVFAALLLVFANVSCRQSIKESTVVSADDYAVYSIYLNNVLNSLNRPPLDTVVLYDSTVIHSHSLDHRITWESFAGEGYYCVYDKDTTRCRQARDKAWKSVYEELKTVTSQKPRKLAPNFATHIPVTILSRDRIRQLYEQYDDETVHIYTFHISNVAYNEAKDKALFVSSFFCQGNCGQGNLIMLQRTDNRWQLIDSFQLWIN